MYKGLLCHVGVRLDTPPHFFIVPNHKVFTMFLLASGLGRFLACQKVFIRNGQHLFVLHVTMGDISHDHPRTRRCTIHPCTLTTTLTKNTTHHISSVHIWTSLACQWMRSVGSCHLIGRRGLGSGKSARAIAKDRRWPSKAAVFVNLLRQSSEETRRRVMSVVLKGVKRQSSWTRCPSSSRRTMGRISMKFVSKRFTLCRAGSRDALRLLRLRPWVIRTVPTLQDRHIRDRPKFAEEMLARLKACWIWT